MERDASSTDRPAWADHVPPVIRGRQPRARDKEAVEYAWYESGCAEVEARGYPGDAHEPWLNVLASQEPSARPACAQLLNDARVRPRLRGTVIDVGAGTCWLSAELSKLPEVAHIYAVDLSEKFLVTSGLRVLRHLGGRTDKITFVASDFNELPLDDECADCACMFACLHHSLSPIKTLMEAARCLRPGGCILVLENPPAVLRLRGARRQALAQSTHATEIAYTKGEIEYLFANAGLHLVSSIPLDVLCRRGWRRAVRLTLRRASLEHVLINLPTYLWVLARP